MSMKQTVSGWILQVQAHPQEYRDRSWVGVTYFIQIAQQEYCLVLVLGK